MQPRTPRLAALVAAPLLVVGATALVMLPRGGANQPAPSADGPEVEILRPRQDAILPLDPVVVTAMATDPDGVAVALLYVDGKQVDTALTSGGSPEQLTFEWTPEDAGDATITVRARDNAEKWGEDVITISVGTGHKPLPPPPTTAFATTSAPVAPVPGDSTTVPGSTTATTATSTAPLVPTTTRPSATAATPAPAPAAAPTVPGTPSPVLPPATAPLTTEPATAPPTTPVATLPPTTPAPVVVPTTVSPPQCKLDPPVALLPLDRSFGVPTSPTFAWAYLGSCLPDGQALRIRVKGGVGSTDVLLSAGARSYHLSSELPPCAEVNWSVVAYDAGQKPRSTRNERFTTAGCLGQP